MKYMGNKSKMLPVLGEVLFEYSKNARHIADPFCGSASVSWFLAQNTDKAVIAGDIQSYAVARAKAVIERVEVFDPDDMLNKWFLLAVEKVQEIANYFPNELNSFNPDWSDPIRIEKTVLKCRNFCSKVLPVVLRLVGGAWPLTKAYGGHYYSPAQALMLDALRQTVPNHNHFNAVAMAALVEAASLAAASPGHTAQPFQPTKTSAPYIVEAWKRDPYALVSSSVAEIAAMAARNAGSSLIGDFEETISLLEPEDVVFADPPYSGVHYSRFYHCLETITRGKEFEPEGVGRYPSLHERPSSAFSKKSEAFEASRNLLLKCFERNAILILTFPEQGSNGLKATDFIDLGKKIYSRVNIEVVESDFSTLGGNKKNREARQKCNELIMCFIP